MALNKPRRPTLFKPVAGKSPTTSETSAVAGPVGAGSSDVETKEGGMAADASHGISRPEATAKATSVSGSSERAAMQPRTEYLPDRSGEVLLHAVFPKLLRRGEPFRIAIPMLDCIPKLKVPFIYAFLQRCRGTDSLDSIEAYARTLQNGFIEFLCENDLNKISLSDIDDALAAKFVEWLNRTEDGKAVMAIATRSNALILLRKMMVILAESETWGSQVGAMTVLRMVHWPGRATAGTPIEALDVDHMAAIWRACVAEIAETVGRCIFKGSTYKEGILLVEQDALSQYLAATDYALIWTVASEKRAGDDIKHVAGRARQSAVYVFNADGSVAEANAAYEFHSPEDDDGEQDS